MVSEAMKEAVGVGGDAGGGEGNQRAERRGRAFQRDFVEQVAVHVDMECGIVFNQVALRFDGDSLAPSGNLHDQLDVDSYRRANLDILAQAGEALGGDVDCVGVKGDVGKRELAGGIGGRGLFILADGVGNMDGCGLSPLVSRRMIRGIASPGQVVEK